MYNEYLLKFIIFGDIMVSAFIKKLVTGFEAKGWIVYTNAPDKDDGKQVVIQQEAVDIVKETATSYRYTPTIKMRAVIDNDVLDEELKEAIQITETAVTPEMIDWQIVNIDIQPMGTTNYVTISGTYVEILYVTNV